MTREEKEQWLYETYEYTSNFDFKILEKYKEADNEKIILEILKGG